MKPLAFIRQRSPFDRLDESQLRLIEQTLEIFHFLPGTYILKQYGAPSSYLYLIRQGTVRLLHKGEEVGIMSQGETFGYPSMLLQSSPNLDVMSGGNLVLYGIPEQTFQQLIDHQAFAEYFLKDLSQRLHETWELDPGFTPGSELARPVRTLIRGAPVSVSPEATVREVARLMRDRRITSVMVEGEKPGIITTQDLCSRVVAEGFGPETLVRQAMTDPLKTLPADTPIYGALFFMIEERIKHLPLTEAGRIIGLITNGDLLRHQARSPLYLLQQLDTLESSDALATYRQDITNTVRTHFRDGLYVDQIGRIVASLNDALLKRLLKLAETDLGPPPTPYAWLVFGSEGRMEQTLLTDQDNALVYEEDTAEARTYFGALTERVIDRLIQVGFPPCPGGYMATNWRRPLADWAGLFRGWVNRPEPQALLEAAIFFDFRVVHGELTLDSLHEIMATAKEQPIFLAHLARLVLGFRPPLGFLWGIRDENGQVDLKKGGIAPVVGMARLYALEAGAPDRSTVERLEAAVQAGQLSEEGATGLIEAFRFLLWLRLREQLAEIKAGETPDNKIHLNRLLTHEKRRLRESFETVRDMQEVITQRYRTDMLGG